MKADYKLNRRKSTCLHCQWSFRESTPDEAEARVKVHLKDFHFVLDPIKFARR